MERTTNIKVFRMFFAVIMCVAILMNALSVQDNVACAKEAGKLSVKKKAALSSYAKILLQKKYRNETDSGRKGKDYHFSICDLNGDQIPEMILYRESIIWGIIGYYCYANGKAVKVKGPSGDESYPCWGTLFEMPKRKSFAFFRGGPAVEDFMPYTILEYKIIKSRIRLVNTVVLYECTDGTNEYFLNGEPCKASVYKNMAKNLKEIPVVPNSKANRKKYGVNHR